MSKEQQELLDEVYENYKNKTEIMMGHGFHGTLLSQEEFINKIKTDPEFSETWGLKIEERELSLEERVTHYETTLGRLHFIPPTTDMLDKENIPTKLITVTYRNQKIESYE
jgi:hypothetical protein